MKPINFANNVRVEPSQLHEDKFFWRVVTEDGETWDQGNDVASEELAESQARAALLTLQEMNRDVEGEDADHENKVRSL